MEQELVVTETRDNVFTIIFNRPERRNALNYVMLTKINEIIGRIRQEGRVRCLVLRGAGDKAFSSGYDIADIPTNLTPEETARIKRSSPFQGTLNTVLGFPYPVIAMINGAALGAACDLTLCCDIRIAAENALMGIPPAKLGIVYQAEGIQRIVNVAGLANAKEMIFTGRSYAAPAAKDMGLVHYVLPQDRLESFTYDMAREISENAPLSLKGMKFIFNRCLAHQRLDPASAAEVEALRAEAFNSEDIKEGQRAFKEKRKPVFQGT
ncbi:MAG TPA: enoyl-CoA hydratase-related protein [Thermodesulfobacteriota bacterium]|nr:enoyl-CoA hydratase-related protein [Thermodesulfobacteriota bacterium]